MSQSHGINGRTANEEECFLWERGAFVWVELDNFNFQDILNAQLLKKKKTPKGKKKQDKKKHKRFPLMCAQFCLSALTFLVMATNRLRSQVVGRNFNASSVSSIFLMLQQLWTEPWYSP